MNYGYAVLNENGKLIQDMQMEYEDERFPIQLYHYVATGTYFNDLKKIMEFYVNYSYGNIKEIK